MIELGRNHSVKIVHQKHESPLSNELGDKLLNKKSDRETLIKSYCNAVGFRLQWFALLILAYRIRGAMFNAPASWSAVALHRFSLAPQNRPPFQITLALRPTFNDRHQA